MGMSASSQSSPQWTRRETEQLLTFVSIYGERFHLIHDMWQQIFSSHENSQNNNNNNNNNQKNGNSSQNPQSNPQNNKENNNTDNKSEVGNLGLHSRMIEEIKARYFQIVNINLKLQ